MTQCPAPLQPTDVSSVHQHVQDGSRQLGIGHAEQAVEGGQGGRRLCARGDGVLRQVKVAHIHLRGEALACRDRVGRAKHASESSAAAGCCLQVGSSQARKAGEAGIIWRSNNTTSWAFKWCSVDMNNMAQVASKRAHPGSSGR